MSQAQYTDQITRLIQQQGDQAAAAADRRGQIWGGALATLGRIPQDVQQVQRQRSRDQLQQQELGLRTQQLGLAVGKEQRAETDRQATRTALQDSGGDLESAIPAIMQTNPEAGLKLQEALRQQKHAELQSKSALLDYHSKVNNVIADALGPVADAADAASQQSALDSAHATLKKLGIPTDDLPTQAGPDAAAKAAALRQGTMSAKDQLAAKQKALEDQIKALTAASQAKDREADNAQKAKHETAMEAAANRQADAAMIRAKRPPTGSNEPAPVLTPQALDITAENYVKTGQLPAMGLGKEGAALRSKIINRAAELHPETDLASNRAGYGSDSASLKKLQSQRDAIGAFEQTASKNIDIFLDTAGKVVDTGSPLANTFIRAASAKLLGSPDQAKYDAARQVAINEIAKITTNPNLSGALSDNARHEVEAYNPNSATLKQTVAVMRLLKQDMDNRTKAMDEQIAQIKSRLGGGGAKSGEVKPAATGGPAVGEKRTYRGETRTWNGSEWVK